MYGMENRLFRKGEEWKQKGRIVTDEKLWLFGLEYQQEYWREVK